MQPKSNNNYDVFFCYARKDYRIVKQITSAINSAGYTSFVDAECILPGENVIETIQNQLYKCKAFVCIVSENAVMSEFFIKEVSYAVSIGKFIIPIKIDDSPITDRLTLLIGNLQYIYWDDSLSEKYLIDSLNHYIKIKRQGQPQRKKNSPYTPASAGRIRNIRNSPYRATFSCF